MAKRHLAFLTLPTHILAITGNKSDVETMLDRVVHTVANAKGYVSDLALVKPAGLKVAVAEVHDLDAANLSDKDKDRFVAAAATGNYLKAKSAGFPEARILLENCDHPDFLTPFKLARMEIALSKEL